MGPLTPRASLKRKRQSPTSFKTSASLQAELARLQQRYDELLSVKERAGKLYRADYQKWRNFKEWMVSDSTFDKHGRLTAEGQRALYARRDLHIADQLSKGLLGGNIELPEDRILPHGACHSVDNVMCYLLAAEFEIPREVKAEVNSPSVSVNEKEDCTPQVLLPELLCYVCADERPSISPNAQLPNTGTTLFKALIVPTD